MLSADHVNSIIITLPDKDMQGSKYRWKWGFAANLGLKGQRQWDGAITYRMGHRNLTKNQTCRDSPFCAYNIHPVVNATQLPRSPLHFKGGVKESERRDFIIRWKSSNV